MSNGIYNFSVEGHIGVDSYNMPFSARLLTLR
jgi:hypothetical protein